MDDRLFYQAPPPKTIILKESKFNPKKAEIKTDQAIIWENKDSFKHTITGFGINKEILPGEQFTYKFEEPGTYEYESTLQKDMKGTTLVM